MGLLLVPQGAGAALAMPIAGWLTDKLGARPVVSTGTVVAALGMLAYTQLGAHTSYLLLAPALFVVGLGIGSLIVPSMAAVFQTLAREEIPRGTSALNAIQRIAGAIGTAVLAIVLQRAIAGTHSFGTTFWVAAGLIAAGLAPALLLPRTHHERQPGQAAAPTGEERQKAA